MDLKEWKNNRKKKFVVEFVVKKGEEALDQSRNLIFEREIYRIRWSTWLIPLIVYRFESWNKYRILKCTSSKSSSLSNKKDKNFLINMELKSNFLSSKI